MNVRGYRPSNSWLRRQIDASWRRWLLYLTAVAVLVGVTLAAFIGPRQTAVRTRYRIAQLNGEVERLSHTQRRLLLEREALVSAAVLSRELPALGLAPLSPEQVLFLGANERLARAAVADDRSPR